VSELAWERSLAVARCSDLSAKPVTSTATAFGKGCMLAWFAKRDDDVSSQRDVRERRPD
jgi:hypothetical protein